MWRQIWHPADPRNYSHPHLHTAAAATRRDVWTKARLVLVVVIGGGLGGNYNRMEGYEHMQDFHIKAGPRLSPKSTAVSPTPFVKLLLVLAGMQIYRYADLQVCRRGLT